jgi:Tat protein translocase TatB subunit
VSLGAPEILVILVVALIVLGPSRLPEAARQVGKAMAEFRRVTAGFQAEVRDAFQDPTTSAPSPAPEFSVEPVHVPPPLPPAPAPDAVPPAAAPVAESPQPAAAPPVGSADRQLPPEPPAH